MQDESNNLLKEQGLNAAQIFLLLFLLFLPQIIGNLVIQSVGNVEIGHYMDLFLTLSGFTVIFYVGMLALHNRLTNRIYDMVYAKYLIVIMLIFMVIADSYFAYLYQEAYFENQRINIGPRDIVWRDVPPDQLPDYVIYEDFRWGFVALLCAARAIVDAVLVYSLMAERGISTSKFRKPARRRKKNEKSIDEIKANLHPSVMKNYKKEEE